MEILEGRNAARMVSEYIEREVQGFRKATDSEDGADGASPEARAAFNRKPYYSSISIAGLGFKCRPVVRQGVAG